jgi:hypothetical protein
LAKLALLKDSFRQPGIAISRYDEAAKRRWIDLIRSSMKQVDFGVRTFVAVSLDKVIDEGVGSHCETDLHT